MIPHTGNIRGEGGGRATLVKLAGVVYVHAG
jgi:hypothetical protein